MLFSLARRMLSTAASASAGEPVRAPGPVGLPLHLGGLDLRSAARGAKALR